MSKENEDFEKLFTEIVSSNDLNEISENYEANVKMGTKELLLIIQSLSDASSHISEIILGNIEGEDFIFGDNSIYHNLLVSLYKISEDFNECIVEYFTGEIFDEEDEEDE
jgi:FtsZ-interacting cell division protein ZipA